MPQPLRLIAIMTQRANCSKKIAPASAGIGGVTPGAIKGPESWLSGNRERGARNAGMNIPDAPRGNQVKNPLEDPRMKEVPKGVTDNVQPRSTNEALVGHSSHERAIRSTTDFKEVSVEVEATWYAVTAFHGHAHLLPGCLGAHGRKRLRTA